MIHKITDCQKCNNGIHVGVEATPCLCPCNQDPQKGWEEELEEFGHLHEGNCNVLQEEECDCDMGGVKPFIREVLSITRKESIEECMKIVKKIGWERMSADNKTVLIGKADIIKEFNKLKKKI